MMTGLPGDSPEKSLETARRIAALKPDGVRIYPTVIVRDTALFDLWQAGRYKEHSVEDAVEHIAAHSTGHSDAILSQTASHIERFTAAVDSAAVYVNCSTRFTDGGEFGLGCEMGISTQKLHARGPMGLAELCTYKYIIRGDGQIRA